MQMPTAKFAEFLKHRKEFIKIDDTETYKRARVQLHWKGIVVRDEVQGAGIRTKEQQIARVGELLVAEIDAKVGGVGIVPADIDGAIVSSHYFLFQIDEAKCSRAWLDWFIRAGGLEDQITARGSTNYAAIRPQHVLEFELPIIPLDEQRGIVSRIEELAVKVEEAKNSRRQAAAQIETLFPSASSQVFEALDGTRAIGNLADITDRITKGESPEWQGFTYQEQGPLFIRSENVRWGQLDLSNAVHIPILFHKKLLRSQLKKEDVLINLVGASIGRCAVFAGEVEEANVNQAVAVISPSANKLESRYLMRFLNSAKTQEIIHGGKVETARPNISLGDLRALQIPLPSIAEQLHIVAHCDDLEVKTHSLRKLQSETAAELDALMPSILSRAFRGEL